MKDWLTNLKKAIRLQGVCLKGERSEEEEEPAPPEMPKEV